MDKQGPLNTCHYMVVVGMKDYLGKIISFLIDFYNGSLQTSRFHIRLA